MTDCWTLGTADIHAYVVPLRAIAASSFLLSDVLSAEEMHAADRMGSDDLRRHCMASRIVLRCLLACYLDVPAKSLRITTGKNGKPDVRGAVRFNLSHSGSLALLAFSRGCEIGVDIEEIRTFADSLAIAARFFSPEEASELTRLPMPEQERAFFRCWTRKEAYIKATSEGLSVPLDSFRVSLAPNEPARFIRLPNHSRWSLYDIRAAHGYAAALAHAGPQRSLEIRTIGSAETFYQGLKEGVIDRSRA